MQCLNENAGLLAGSDEIALQYRCGDCNTHNTRVTFQWSNWSPAEALNGLVMQLMRPACELLIHLLRGLQSDQQTMHVVFHAKPKHVYISRSSTINAVVIKCANGWSQELIVQQVLYSACLHPVAQGYGFWCTKAMILSRTSLGCITWNVSQHDPSGTEQKHNQKPAT